MNSISILEIGQGISQINEGIFDEWTSLTKIVYLEDGNITKNLSANAFYNCSNLTSLVLPEALQLQTIERNALGHTGLSSIYIPRTVISINSSAFSDSSNFTTFNVDEQNETYTDIDGVLFSKDKTTLVTYPYGRHDEYTVPDDVTKIGDKAFSYHSNIPKLTIPASIEYIPVEDFEYCSALTEISVAGENANYSSTDGALFNKAQTELLLCPKGNEGSYSIPDTVTDVNKMAFRSSEKLTSVSVPASVESFASEPFYNCTELQSITVDPDNQYFCAEGDVLFNKNKTELIKYPGKKDGDSYDIPSTVKKICGRAFEYCSSLSAVTLPEGLLEIGNSAFTNCSSISAITIPASVSSIGNYAFSGNTGLETVTFKSSAPPTMGSDIFQSCIKLETIFVPAESENEYKAALPAYQDKIVGVHKHDGIDFISWGDNDSLPTEAGSYFLTTDVAIASTWNVPVSDSAVNLCLNGHVIKSSADRAIEISNGAILNLYDCKEDRHYFDKDDTGLWVPKEDGTSEYSLAGGYILGGVEVYGSTVMSGGTFNMYGGNITGTQASNSGGGAFVTYGTFNMYGGSIKGNTAIAGGGVTVNAGTFNMYGGSITENTADSFGGGVCDYNGTFTMTGGEIIDNTCSNNGGGVYYQSGTVTLGGTAKIAGNCEGTGESRTASNLYLPDGNTITISADSAPADGMLIGITMQASGNFTSDNASEYIRYFTSDNDSYYVAADGSKLKLAEVGENVAQKITTGNVYSTVDNAFGAADENEEIRLIADCTTAGITVEENITLDLNGKVLQAGFTSSCAITVSSGALALKDSSPSILHKFSKNADDLWVWDESDGTEVIYGGVITGGNNSDLGGGVFVKGNGSTLNMYGGNVVGNKGRNGSGVCVESGTFNMYGNSMVAGNSGAPGVYVGRVTDSNNGTFTMSGNSRITCNNTKGQTGGVVVNYGDFTMSGGSIDNNEGNIVGGVNIMNSTFTMTGGEITGNKAPGCGGVYFVGDTLTLGGTAKITGNALSDGTASNLLLNNNKTVALGSDPAPSDMLIGVTTRTAPTSASPVAITTNGETCDTAYFVSDNSAYEVVSEGNQLVLKVKPAPAPAPSYDGGSSSSTVTVPVSGDKNSVNVSASVSGSTATVKKISDADLAKVTDGESVSIDLSGAGKNVDTAKLPTETVEKIAEKNALSVKLPAGAVEFDKTATEEIVDQAKGSNIELVVDDIKETSLNAAQKQAVGKLDTALIIDAHLASGGSRLCTEANGGFRGGKAKVVLPYEIKNNRKAENYSVFYAAENGTLEKLNAVYDTDLKAFVFEISHFSNYVVAYNEKACPQDETCVYAKFTDADTTAWYHDGVHFCVENGLMNGVADDKFAPSGTLSRGMIVTMLWRMEDEPVVNYAMTFKDVAAGKWYTEAIRWAQSTGVAGGYSADSFGPDDDVTREQLATILYNYAKLKGQGFTGSWMFLLDFADRTGISSWADEAVHWCSMKGIVNGKDGKVFDPQGKATRAEAAAMVQRFCQTALTEKD